MNPVRGGFVPHKIKGDGDYEAQKRAAMAQSTQNSYIQGVQQVMQDGAGEAIAGTRTKYGNVNIMPQQVLEGATSNFQYTDAPGNAPLEDLPNQTGSVPVETSSTKVPQEDPKEMEADALEHRLALMAKGGQGFPGLNNRNREI